MAVSAATVAKITSAVASDKNAKKVIGIIIGSVIGLLLIPLIAYMGIIGNMDSIEIDTNQVQQSIVQNMSAEEKAKLQHIEDVMTGISKECSKRKLKNIVNKKAQAVRCVQLRKHSKAREKRYSFGYAVSFIFACYQILWTFPKSRYLCSRYLPLVCG